MIRAPLEQAFETCQKNKSDWMSSKSALARAEMALKAHELTSTRYEPDAVQALRDDIDLKKWTVNRKRTARTVLTGMCYSVGSVMRQGSSSLTRLTGQSAMTSRTWRR